MAQTYAQLQEQIAQLEAQSAQLQQEAATLRTLELKDVIEQAITTIAEYGITAAQLGFRPGSGAKEPTAQKIKYADGNGNTWGGRGKRPNWLRQSGQDIERFRV